MFTPCRQSCLSPRRRPGPSPEEDSFAWDWIPVLAGMTFRVGRLGGSWRVPRLVDEADDNVLERALLRVEVLEADAGVAYPPEQRGHPSALGIGVEHVEQLVAVRLEREVPFRKLGRDRRHRLDEVQGQLLLAELLHQARF